MRCEEGEGSATILQRQVGRHWVGLSRHKRRKSPRQKETEVKEVKLAKEAREREDASSARTYKDAGRARRHPGATAGREKGGMRMYESIKDEARLSLPDS